MRHLVSSAAAKRLQMLAISDRCEFVGILDIGYDLVGFPQRACLDRMQADRPVAAPRGAGRCHDIELHLAAERMPLQRIGDACPDLIDRCRRSCKKRLKVHHCFPRSLWQGFSGRDG